MSFPQLKLGCVVLLFKLAAIAPPAVGQQEILQEHATRGIAYFQQGNFRAAEQEFRKVLETNPNVAELQDLMGVILDRQGKHQEATPYFFKAIELNPKFAAAHHHLGLNYLQLDQLELASQSLTLSLELDPNQAEAHNNLGNIHVRNQQYAQALQAFKKANRLAPENPNILFNLLRAELRLNQKASSAHRVEALLKLPRTDAALAARLGRELTQYELYVEAASAYEHALRLKPHFPEIYYDLSLCYFRVGRFRDSLATLERLPTLSSDDGKYLTLLGLNYRELGDLQKAINSLQRALQLEPNNPDYIYNFGMTLLRTDAKLEAHRLFREAAGQFSAVAPVLYGLGVASFYLGLNDEAREHLENAMQLDPNQAEYHSSLGDVYSAAGEYEKARDSYVGSISLEPSNANYHLKAGRNYLKLQQQSNARTEFDKVMEADPSNAEARYQLGKIAASTGNHKQAVSYLEQAVALDPLLKEAHYQLGLLYRRLGENQKAAQTLSRFRKLKQADGSSKSDGSQTEAPGSK